MYTNGFAARTRISRYQFVHIVVDDSAAAPTLFCSGGKAIPGQPTQYNRPCAKCLHAAADHDDGADLLAEIGWPWRGLTTRDGRPRPTEEQQ